MISRREWLTILGVGLIGCGAPPSTLLWPDGGGEERLDPGPLEPDHAAASFEVSDHDAVVAVWAPEARSGFLVVEDVRSGEQARGDWFDLDRGGGTGAARLTGLTPGRSYRWHLRFDTGRTSDWYALVTAPPPSLPAPLTFLYSADIDLDPAYDSPIFSTMAASGADFFVSLGDWPYADNAPGAWTVDEFRVKHREVRRAAKVQELLHAMSVRAIYDDHEARNNWDGRFTASEPERIAAAVQVWDEWFPLGDPSVPPGSALRYRSWRWGALAELFLLDTRLYRSADNAPDDAAKTMLGAVQKQWLIDGLTASAAAFKLVFTTIPLDFGTDNDDWSLFTVERDAILGAIVDAGVTGVVFLSADQHWFAAYHHASGFVEWQVGPLCRGFRSPPAPEPGVVVQIPGVYNYGEVSIQPGNPPQLTFTARDPDGAALYTETVLAG